MFRYYLQLALLSLRRSPVLSLLMVVAIGLGIGASMTTYGAFRAIGSDPIPWKSRQLYVPQVDIWGPQDHTRSGDAIDAFDYTDAMALMNAHAAKRQSALYPVAFSLVPDDAAQRPLALRGHAVFGEFFGMVDAPFREGGAWSAADDESATPVVVIGRKLAEQLFGGQAAVGRSVNLDGQRFRVVGVLDEWEPQPRFYDLHNTDAFGRMDQFFIPFNWAIDHQISTSGNGNCNRAPNSGWQGWLNSSCVWIGMLVELPTADDAIRYRQFLDHYAAEQQRAGRFAWPPANQLRNLPDWLVREHVVPDEVFVEILISAGFLAVCLVNVVGLMLAKFLRRAPEIGVRRALGAPRFEIYRQFLVEAGVIGLAGGLLGVLLTLLGRAGLQDLLQVKVDRLAQFDPWLMVLTLGVSLLATTLAALYPAARAAAVRPAWQLKSN